MSVPSESGARPVIYQLVVRLFGNTNERRKLDGTLEENGCGTFEDVNEAALDSLRALGVTHVWLTGVFRQATLTDYGSIGLPADPPEIVKGRAGSFYAVRDYYDVCPDYAHDPRKRHEDFDALVRRIHAAGMKVLLDLVPNHVARSYGSVIEPSRDFGLGDDETKFFSPDNDFFYLAEPPDQSLTLPKPSHWSPEGVVFGGSFARESGGRGRVPRATGNNVTSPRPTEHDWYETVKLDYGFDFVTGEERFTPEPKTWGKIDAILAHWQARGVDGFRCDFAHYVPARAWRHLLGRLKERDPNAFVLGEAYENHGALFDAGFDALYDFETYNLVKSIYLGRASARDLETRFASMNEGVRRGYVEYLENHDERRLASPLVPGASTGETGFGSARAAKQLAPLLFLHGHGPVLIYDGQEVGERGEVRGGFGGGEGRTSIFDYTSIPALVKWVNGHAYDGGHLDDDQRALRVWYGDLLALCQHASFRGAGRAFLDHDRPGEVIAFARFAPAAASLSIVAVGFAMGRSTRVSLEVPLSVAFEAGLDRDAACEVRVVFDERGHQGEVVARCRVSDLEVRRIEIEIADQSAVVLHIERAEGPL